MMRRYVSLPLLLLLGVAAGHATASAQDVSSRFATGGPRFLRSTPTSMEPLDVRRTPVLRQRVSLDFADVRLDDALAEITRQSGLRFMYSNDVVPLDRHVTVRMENVSLAAALTELLLDADVDIVLSETLRTMVLRRTANLEQAEPGTVVGRVTASESGDPVPYAQITVDGRGRAVTNEDGRYRIEGVEAGRRTIGVQSLGFAAATREVEVGDAATVTVDFALEVSPSRLDELVVTATGRQRRVELGHVVGRINADSIVKEAPVSTLSELLAGRVPGLHVSTHSGMVGGSVSLQSRSPNSISLDNEPILIVDGIRYANDRTGRVGPFNHEETSRLNDLNPNDIESIEVIKGPSAATLYGTDAANGVIVITTKRGRSGPARWRAYARAERKEIPDHEYPEAYWAWGTVFNIPDANFASCTLMLMTQGRCTQQDSIVRMPHPLNDPELTMYHAKPAWEYGMNVSGGSPDLRYYFSTDVKEATGPIQLPAATIPELKEAWGVEELPDEVLEPNAQRQVTVRGNLTLGLGPAAELQFNSGYGNSNTRTAKSSYAAAFGDQRPDQPYGLNSDLAYQFPQTSTEQTDRVFGSVKGQWRPARWLQGRGTFGLDLANSERYSLVRPEHQRGTSSRGQVQEDRTRRLTLTGDVGLSTEARAGRVSLRTAIGAQYTREKTNQLISGGVGLPPGAESVPRADHQYVQQYYVETATLGSYVEETIGLNGRLFVTGALRADGGSNFGRDYSAAVYPKASASWLLSEEPFLPRIPGLDELRLRYAFGASGKQPRSGMVRPEYSTRNALVDGVTSTVIRAGAVGNVDLRPERVREHEFGVDAAGLGGRLWLELTWFDRVTTDQIVSRPASLGFGRVYRNLGRLSSRGFEADLTVQPIETRHVTWQVTLRHASRRSMVEDLGGLTPSRQRDGGYVEGYSLGARFAPEILGWEDANGDGILEPSELTMSPEPVYQGESTAPRAQTLITSVGLFQQRLRLSATFQRQSGHTQIDAQGCGRLLCRASVDPTVPLAAQALVVAPFVSSQFVIIEPADHTRLEEVTVAFELPEDLLRMVRLGTGTVSLSGRNLALWTLFGGPDPASSSQRSYLGGTARNIPQNRTWALRFDLGS